VIPYRERWHRSEGGVYTRAPHMMGMGMGVGFSSPPPWTPASVPGCILYGGAYQEARAVRAAQPTLLNGDFSGGTANWTALGDAVLTAETYLGRQCLRLNWGGTDYATATQACLISGNRYRYAGGMASDVNAGAAVYAGSGRMATTGALLNQWIDDTGEATSTSGSLGLWLNQPGDKIARFSAITRLDNLSLTSYTPAFTTVAGSVLAQATATAQPWVSSDGLGIRYQGGDMLQWSAAASNVKCLHDGTGGTLIVAVRINAINAQNVIAATATQNVTQTGINLWFSAGQISLIILNGSGAYDTNTTAAITTALNTTYVFTVRVAAGANGVTVRQNSVNKITATLTAPSAANPTSRLALGAHTAGSVIGSDAIVGHPFVANRVLTDAECTSVENYILAQATL
jgi:hypothetical protein